MKVVMFYHSLISDWNHGNAHFLRGIVKELIKRGNVVDVYEPENGWSVENLIKYYGNEPIAEFRTYYPGMDSIRYNEDTLELKKILEGADLVIVHEWNSSALVKRIGEIRRNASFKLLFHDTHHRAVTKREEMENYDLRYYDGVLAFGNIIKNIYLSDGWIRRAWTWHEAADTSVFHPYAHPGYEGDVVWIGNWGDDERTAEIHEFLIEPVKKLGLKCKVFGVRYPDEAVKALNDAGIEYGGWLPNYKVPEMFSKYKFTVHIPRRPYMEALPGIPTIRPFEALACGIPMITSWNKDTENLFNAGIDYKVVSSGEEMKETMEKLMNDEPLRRDLAKHGLQTLLHSHTCSKRVDELYKICEQLELNINSNITAE